MADFCKQCSLSIFGEDCGDLANLTAQEDWNKGLACVVLCEGCGAIQVDPLGTCVSVDCIEKHGKDMKFGTCAGCKKRRHLVVNLEGDDLCNPCADAWCQSEGQAAQEYEQELREAIANGSVNEKDLY